MGKRGCVIEKQETGRGYSPSKFKEMFVKKKQERYARETSNCDGDFIGISNGSSLGLFIWQIEFLFSAKCFTWSGRAVLLNVFFPVLSCGKKNFFSSFEEGKNTVAPSQTAKNSFLFDWYRAICQRRPPSNIGRSSLTTSSPKNSR